MTEANKLLTQKTGIYLVIVSLHLSSEVNEPVLTILLPVDGLI